MSQSELIQLPFTRLEFHRVTAYPFISTQYELYQSYTATSKSWCCWSIKGYVHNFFYKMMLPRCKHMHIIRSYWLLGLLPTSRRFLISIYSLIYAFIPDMQKDMDGALPSVFCVRYVHTSARVLTPGLGIRTKCSDNSWNHRGPESKLDWKNTIWGKIVWAGGEIIDVHWQYMT